MIRKVKGGYRVISHKTRRNLGKFRTKRAAKRRLRQVIRFKYYKRRK